MAANDRQIGGTHYKGEGKVEHWDIVAQWNLDYFQGQITKYIMRWKSKGGLQDLEKARHFLDKYIELESKSKKAKDSQGHIAVAPDRGQVREGATPGRAEYERTVLTPSD